MRARRQRCSALLSDKSRRCTRWSMKGQTVCYVHGGASPQARRSAQERLDELAEPAVGVLADAIGQARDRKIPLHPGAQRAAVAVLDRTGHRPISRVELLGLDNAKVTLVQEHGREIARVLRGFALQLGHNPDSEEVRKAGRAALETIGGPFEDGSGWFGSATTSEKKTLLSIMERCLARMEGRAPESGNGHAKEKVSQAPPPAENVSETLDEVETL